MQEHSMRYLRGGVAAAVVIVGGVAGPACNAVLGVDDIDANACPKPDERRCATEQPQQPQKCLPNGQWQDNGPACDYLCTEGQCTGACKPDQKQCTGNTPQTCDADGQWVNNAACMNQTCVPETGTCEGQCAEGGKRCSEKQKQSCGANGQWLDDGPACDYLCSDGQCTGACKPEQKQCTGNTPQTCSADGQWVNNAACTNQTCVPETGTCEGQCAEGLKRCSEKQPQSCGANGQWQDDGPACDYLCSEGQCSGVCNQEETRCTSNTLQICDANAQWQDQLPCVDKTCNERDAACVGVCAPGKRCVDNTPQSCNASGLWESEPACGAGTHCEGGTCVVDCTPGDLRCMENTSQTCDANGEWQDSEACVSQTCLLAECVGVCAPGEEQCSGDMFETCGTNGEWEIPAASYYKTCCNGSLVNAATDPANCAMCGITCNAAANEICQTGGAPGPSCANVDWARWPMPNGAVDFDAGAPNLASYIDNGNGTVTDMVTGLMWQQAVGPGLYMWVDAKTYCSITLSNLALGGHHDWRLPSRIELVSLVDYGLFQGPAINAAFFPGIPSSLSWSASEVFGAPGVAYVVSFYEGASYGITMMFAGQVRCVR